MSARWTRATSHSADEACWPKANPSLGVTIQPEYLRKQVREALGMPAKQSLVRRLNFCQWVDAANPAIDGDLWRQCEAEFDEDELAGLECVGGLDLSGTRDSDGAGSGIRAGCRRAWCMRWWSCGRRADTVAERSARDRVPMAQWVNEGHIAAPPGRNVDYGFVAQRLSELQVERGLRRVAYDPYRIQYLGARS